MHKTAKFDAILFDKDGTIFDSETLTFQAWMHAAKVFNVPFSAKQYELFIGIPTDTG